jgi:hypothetical protein
MEIEKHMITDFSGLEVHLITTEHVFGAFLLRLLGMHRIRTATRSLKIVLQRFVVIFSTLIYPRDKKCSRHILELVKVSIVDEASVTRCCNSQMKDRCTPLVNCSCDERKDWRAQTISLANLEKVEIKQFNGQDHEFDFLKLIFRCAPMLRRVALELTKGFTPDNDWCTEIHSIFMGYPSVECTVDRPGKNVQHTFS